MQRKVIDPAILDVNKLSDLNVSLRVNRRHARAPISSIDIGWGKKSGEEFREVQQELNRSKVGRPARLKGQGENIRQQILIPTLPLEYILPAAAVRSTLGHAEPVHRLPATVSWLSEKPPVTATTPATAPAEASKG